jgi:hypothetical protein
MVVLYLLTFSLLSFVPFHAFKTVSYTSQGEWANGTNWECDHFLCSSKREAWRPDDPNFMLFNATTGCQALKERNITEIQFHGDSYMRQIYAAMLITLSGDFQYGSIRDPKASPTCTYHRQFYEKKCGLKELNHYGYTCNRTVLLNPLLTGLDNLNECTGNLIKLWSFGNHKLSRYGRHGVNNATAFQELFNNSICPHIRDASQQGKLHSYHTNETCSIWWISTHWRIIGWFDDEKEPIVYDYNRNMRQFFDDGECGPINYIDVYNMTYARRNKTENSELSYDMVHWGMEINLVKAQIILNAILNTDKPTIRKSVRLV